ncbi:MAG: adenylate/guanylate cyclase domain-containing protein [Nevskiaceae bacterium]|nr:MAG: adenylate/guanylate cyclase domain-containing protein [Nevskiaceae bacterium]
MNGDAPNDGAHCPQLPAVVVRGAPDHRPAFSVMEAQQLARRWRLFAPVTAILLGLTEVAPYLTTEFPPAPLLTGSIMLLLCGMYVLARSEPSRPVIAWATVIMGVIGGGYAASASALTGQFASPHSLAMAVTIALLPGMMAVSVLEATLTILGGIAAWTFANLHWATNVPTDYAGLATSLTYLLFLALITVLTVWRNRQLRYSEFVARAEVERMHRFTVEELLYRHLPAPYVEQVLSGARMVDQPPERRIVTVMFADLVGFTSIAEATPPDDLAALLGRFYDLISTEAAQHGATLDKFIGDSVMVFFGAPQGLAPEVQARRALALACRWQQRTGELKVNGRPLRLRIGIHQDLVTVGSFGGRLRSDYTVLGLGVNIAARLEPLCRPGRILVSQDFARLLPDQPWQDLGQQPLKGLPEPLALMDLDPAQARLGDARP